MSIHSLDLLDLPALYRYRGEAVSLDTARLLTRGNPLGAIGVMAYANPRRHIYSAVAREDGTVVAGGIIHTNGDPFAHLLYLAPASGMDHPVVPALVENLITQAGTWGVLHVVAEPDESSPAFVPLRRAGFSVYAWQRIWDVTQLAAGAEQHDGKGDTAASSDGSTQHGWHRVDSVHMPAVQNLHHQIVPALLQAVEPAPDRAGGFLCNGGVRAHVSMITGMVGVVLFPLIHPDVADVSAKLSSLIRTLPNRGGRPVYVCVRSYQAWLEPVLEDLGAKPEGRQAIMVKHLARLVKEEQTVRAKQPAKVGVPASGITRSEHRKS